MPKRRPKKTAKKRKKRARYADFAAEWDRRREDRGGGDWLVDKPEVALDALPFLQTLRALRDATQDKRFADLHHFIMTSGLVELVTTSRKTTYNWSRPALLLAHPLALDACKMIENRIAGGISERLAVAEAVVALNINANSFTAACKRLERLLHEYQKVRQKPA